MGTTFTPGEWTQCPVHAGDKVIRIEAPGDGFALLYCEVSRDDCCPDTAAANARLIAAAPDLFAACEALDSDQYLTARMSQSRKNLAYVEDVRRRARTALAKAKGV